MTAAISQLKQIERLVITIANGPSDIFEPNFDFATIVRTANNAPTACAFTFHGRNYTARRPVPQRFSRSRGLI